MNRAPAISLTRHAEVRCCQRSIRRQDLDLLLQHATDIGDGVLTMLPADVDRTVAELKRMIGALERLRGATAVVIDGNIVTVYRQDFRRRNTRRRDLGSRDQPGQAWPNSLAFGQNMEDYRTSNGFNPDKVWKVGRHGTQAECR